MAIKISQRSGTMLGRALLLAQAYGQNTVAPEHILYGILAEEEGIAYQALRAQGLTVDKYKAALDQINAREASITTARTQLNVQEVLRAFTPRSKKVMEYAVLVSRQLGRDVLEPEDFLSGIIREGNSVANQILTAAKVSSETLLRDMLEQMQRFGGQPGFGGGAQGGFGGAPGPFGQHDQGGYPGQGPGQGQGSALEEYGLDLTKLARETNPDPVIGRTDEINRVIQILLRRTKNNPVLIGEPGVGKTAIAEGLAQRIVDGSMIDDLKDKRLISIDLTGMLAGAKFRGEFEERIKNVLDEAKEQEDVLLFIDELHTIIGAGASEGTLDASNILKPLLARGEVQIIGATTLDEYRKIEQDGALERRFQPVTIDEPSEEETIEILKGLRPKYEEFHKVNITDEAIEAAVNLSKRYITDRFLPDKAIDLIDEGSSQLRMNTYVEPERIRELQEEILECQEQKDTAAVNEEYEQAAKLRQRELKLQNELEEVQTKWQEEIENEMNTLGEDEIAAVVSSWTGVPVRRLTEDDADKLRHLEDRIHDRVIGQDEAVQAVARAIRRGRLGLKDPHRPAGSFIFLGTTGVGKTELAKALAEVMFGEEEALIRVDMSEYMEKFDVNKLIGSPPGYVGYDEGGQLTEKVRRRPYSVVLFDEIEKAHPDVFNVLLQILDDGRLTDGQGRTVDFTNTIIVMTSNIGAHLLTSDVRTIGFGLASKSDEKPQDLRIYGGKTYDEAKDLVMKELRREFRPEFINRIDEIIFFEMLSREAMSEIVHLMMHSFRLRLAVLNYEFYYSEEAVEQLAERGYDPQYGARPLRREIQTSIEDLFSEEMLSGSIKEGDRAFVDYEDEHFVIRPMRDEDVIASGDKKGQALLASEDAIEVELEELEEISEA